eukprot:jgi/Picre1/35290/NNA_002752.t1
MGTDSSGDVGSKPSSAGDSGVVRDVGSKIFIGGLSWEMTEDMLKEYFEKFGEIIEVVVMRDRVTHKPRGFGFVTFRDASVADVVTLEGTLFGSVSEVQIMLDHLSGRSRGFGFVTFDQEESAYAVFTRGLIHTIRGKHVEVKPATPKGSGSNRSSMDGSSSDWAGSAEYTQQLNSFYNSINQTPYGSQYGMYAPHPMGGRGMQDQQSAMMYANSAMYQQQATHNGMMPYMYMPPGYMAGSPGRYPSQGYMHAGAGIRIGGVEGDWKGHHLIIFSKSNLLHLLFSSNTHLHQFRKRHDE